MNRCPHCGQKMLSTIASQRELIITVLAAVTGNNRTYCECTPEQRKEYKYWKANAITEDEAKDMGDLAYKTWLVHQLPEMGDCRSLNYGYYINPKGHIICEAQGDYYDITEDIAEYYPEILNTTNNT